MNINFIKKYLAQNAELVKTMVIKSDTSAELINDHIKRTYGEETVDKYNPVSWKYFQNIAGIYHSTDLPIIVTSLDTLENIIFSKETLYEHTSTANAYKYGTRYYYALVNKYPGHEQLIQGILNPVDITTAIEAKNGTILGYASHLVEPQEISLIKELEDFIKLYLERWDVQAFGLSDSLYYTAQHAVMYLNILPKLLNLRLKRCKTKEAHSFHIREYLASHGKLDKYLPYMTLKQALYLYRNLLYIENNAGKAEQFEELITKLLTDRNIPISEFSVRQLSSFDNKHYPNITVRRKNINKLINVPEKDYLSLDLLYAKERPIVYGNPNYLDSNIPRITRSFKNSASSVMQTKDLESAMIDYNDAVPDNLEAVLLREWANLASKGLYSAVIDFKDPNTLDNKTLNVLDAFIYMYYLTLDSIGIKITHIPDFINIKASIYPKPSLNYILAVCDNRFKDITDIARELWIQQPVIKRCLSTSRFFELANSIYEQQNRQWFIISNTEDNYKRATVANMILRFYKDERVVLANNTPLTDWLNSKNLPVNTMDYEETNLLIKNIFNKATGFNIDSNKILSNIQKAMLAILTQLSSYSIQLLKEINPSKIKPLNWAAIRPGDFKYSALSDYYLESEIIINDKEGSASTAINVDAETNKSYQFQEQSLFTTYPISNRLSATTVVEDIRDIDVYFNTFRVDSQYIGKDIVNQDKNKFVGWEYYLDLSSDQKQQIVSIY